MSLSLNYESLSTAQSDVLCALRQDGPRALAAYFELYRDRLRNIIHARIDRRLLPRIDSSDVIQETYLTAVKRLQEYVDNPNLPFAVWLRFLTQQHAVAVHRHHFQSQKRDPSREASTSDPRIGNLLVQLTEEMQSPQSQVIAAELRHRTREMLQGLSDHDCEILTIVHLENLSVAEAAESLQLPLETARKRHFRAMQRFRSIAEQLLPDQP